MRDWDAVLRYWRNRHRRKRGSWEAVGRGSVGRLAEWKAGLVNRLVEEMGARRVVDLGCGDGCQAELFEVPEYVGVDISPHALIEAAERLQSRDGWRWLLWEPGEQLEEQGCVGVSLDVVFHLVDDALYHAYMQALFGASTRAVAIYSTNEERPPQGHVRHRNVGEWVAEHMPGWGLHIALAPPWPNALHAEGGSDCWWMVWVPEP